MEFLCSLPLCCDCCLARAYFSTLKAGATIAPHHGRSNVKLRMQLPLLMGSDGYCELTVGGESRRYSAGKLLLFDDSFLHSVVSHSGTDRIVLLCDLWHPQLSPAHIARICHALPPPSRDKGFAAAPEMVAGGAERYFCMKCQGFFVGAECPRAHPIFRYVRAPPMAVAVPVSEAAVSGREGGEVLLLCAELGSVRREVAELRAELLMQPP